MNLLLWLTDQDKKWILSLLIKWLFGGWGWGWGWCFGYKSVLQLTEDISPAIIPEISCL